MGLTQVSTGGIKNATIKNEDIEADTIQLTKVQEMATNHILGRSTSGTGNAEILGAGQVRTILNVADGANQTTINNNADNRVITGSGTANTLNGEADFTYDGDNCIISRGGNSVAGLTVKNVNNSQANAVSQISIEGGDNSYAALQLETNGQSHKLYQLNTGGLGLEKAGVNRITIDANGKVGIGTTSPSHTLHVSGTTQFTTSTGVQHPFNFRNDFTPNVYRSDLLSTGNVTSNNALRIGSVASSGGVTLQGNRQNDSSQKVSLLLNPDGGNVGIGTTSPSQKLHIETNVNGDHRVLVKNPNAGSSARAALKMESDSSTLDLVATSAAYSNVTGWGDAAVITTGSGTTGGLILNTQASGAPIKFQTYASTKMVLDSNGKLGIGTTSPNFMLDVVSPSGNSYITTQRATKAGGQVGIQIKGASGGKDWYLYQHTNENILRLYNTSDSNLIQFTETGMGFTQAGLGISFAATSDVSGMDSELLDDYEEGTWAPSNSIYSVNTQNAHYIKIGKQVTAQAYILFGSMTGTDQFLLSGFPFATPSNQYHSCAVNAGLNLSSAQVVGQFVQSGMFFAKPDNTKATFAEMSSGWVVFSITYVIN